MTDADPWLLFALLAVVLLPASGLCLCYAIGADADARGANGTVWGLLAFVLFPFAAVAYVLYRFRLPDRAEPADRTERRLGAFGIGGTAAFVVAFLVAPPDPFSLIAFALPLLAVFVPAAAIVCYEGGSRAVMIGRP